jgi:hypothetical protein
MPTPKQWAHHRERWAKWKREQRERALTTATDLVRCKTMEHRLDLSVQLISDFVEADALEYDITCRLYAAERVREEARDESTIRRLSRNLVEVRDRLDAMRPSVLAACEWVAARARV